MESWFDSYLGGELLSLETKAVYKVLKNVYGYHQLIIGDPVFKSCLENNRIPVNIFVHNDKELVDKHNGEKLNSLHITQSRKPIILSIVSKFDKLAVDSDNLEIVFLPHCLESSDNAHEVLREAYRVLKPEGHVIITGFNPYSMWGLFKLVLRFFKKGPWKQKFISISKLLDWISLLGLELVELKTYMYLPPVQNPRIFSKFWILEKIGKKVFPFWGSCYIILAKKKVMTLTPIKPTWEQVKEFLDTELVNPTTFNKS